MNFKIGISELIAKSLRKQRSLNQIRHCFAEYIFKSDIIFWWNNI